MSRHVHVCLLLLFCTRCLFAGEDRPLVPYVIEPAPLPEALAVFPGGTLTARQFRTRVDRILRERPRYFDLREGFVRYVLVRLEAARLRLTPPPAAMIEARLRKQVAAAGGEDALRQALGRAGMTVDDLRRRIEEAVQFERVVRTRQSLKAGAVVDEADAQAAYAEALQRYKPVFRGAAHPQPATIGGQDFTRQDLVEYCLRRERDVLLGSIYEALLQERMLLAVARRKGLDVEGADQAVEQLFAKALTPDALAAYYETVKEDFRIIRVQHIFCAYDPRPGMTYRLSQAVTDATRARTRERARTLLQMLQMPESDFAAVARQHSNCPSAAQGGDLGYLTGYRPVAVGLDPGVYGLAYLRTAQGKRSPITLAPLAAIWKAATQVRDGSLSGLVETPTGIAILKRVEARMPKSADAVRELLRTRRKVERRDHLLERLSKKVTIHWIPARRWRGRAAAGGS